MTPPSLPGTENPGKHGSPDFILIMHSSGAHAVRLDSAADNRERLPNGTAEKNDAVHCNKAESIEAVLSQNYLIPPVFTTDNNFQRHPVGLTDGQLLGIFSYISGMEMHKGYNRSWCATRISAWSSFFFHICK